MILDCIYYSISNAGILLGVGPTTIRRCDNKGLIKCIRTVGGHRRIHITEIERIITGKKKRYRKKKLGVATYARVSSHNQKKETLNACGEGVKPSDLIKEMMVTSMKMSENEFSD